MSAKEVYAGTRTPGVVLNNSIWTTYFNLFASELTLTTSSSTQDKYELVRNPSINRRWLGNRWIPWGSRYAWFGTPSEQVALTDAFSGQYDRWGGTSSFNGYWLSSWLGDPSTRGMFGGSAYWLRNNHFELEGGNIAYMDGRVSWKKTIDVQERYDKGNVFWERYNEGEPYW